MPIYRLGEYEPQLPQAGRYWVAPDAHVIGQVTLGLDVSVWFGAVLRGNAEVIRVGDRTNIQEGALLHTDPGFPLTIGKEVTVGHHAILHGCTIADGVLVGMGATILNGAVIGEGSLIGANALVTEGKIIPPRSLVVGSPGKVIRELDDDMVAGIIRSADEYVENWGQFAANLQRLDADR